MKFFIQIIATSIFALALTACETIEGAGEDIENAGDSISDAASNND